VTEQDDIASALRPVAKILQQLGIRYYVGGSVASSFHGAVRSTLDVDVVADITDGQVTPLLEQLGDEFYASEAAIREAVRRKSCFNLIHLPTGVKVDVFANRGREFDESVFHRTTWGEIGGQPAVSVPIATAEDTILSKLQWYRLGGDVSQRQWDDVTKVLRLLGREADVDYLRHFARQIAVADLLDRLLEELNWPTG
jgi:hypothetical protein